MSIMNYEEFKTKLVAEVMNFMPRKYQHYTLSETKIMKTNQILDAITLVSDESNLSPTFYCNTAYNYYEETGNFHETIKDFAEFMAQEMDNTPKKCVSMQDIKISNSNICYRLINTKRNEEWLKQIPHRQFHDLSIIYYCIVPNMEDASIVLTNAHCELLGYTEEQLYEWATENTHSLLTFEVQSMASVIAEMLEFDDEELVSNIPMYIISNKKRIFGAAAMLNDEILQEVAEVVGSNLFIFPSSIHECVCVSADNGNLEDALEMVTDINATQLKVEEFLADSVYFYNRETHELSIAASKFLMTC